jgi:ATP-dependent RNA helicase DDX3X
LFGTDVQTKGINFKDYDDIPVDVSGRDVPAAIQKFDDTKFHEVLADNLKLAGFDTPTPVQKYSVPICGGGRDLMACAQTGSGKTGAFLFPMIHHLLTADLPPQPDGNIGSGYSRRRKHYPYGLVMAPTRELATQIYNEAQKFCYRTGLRACVVYGGADIRKQLQDMDRGVDIVVATPGRLVDFLERGRLSLSLCTFMIFDEADRMLDMGFEPQIRVIVEEHDMPAPGERQTLMFSATFPKEIQQLAQDFMTDYIFLAVGRVGSTTESIIQKVEYVEDRNKRDTLMTILPTCDGLTLIFVMTKRGADALEDYLLREGINATSIHGDRSQHEREHALAMFRCGRCPVLVATDVAARGLDIPNVMWVINYDLPSNIDDYVHRIGRTGRCGNTGTAIAFFNEGNGNVQRELFDILKEANQEIPAWFDELMRTSYRGRGGRRRGNNRFGARDYRRNKNNNNNSRNSGYSGSGSGSGNSRGYSSNHSNSNSNSQWGNSSSSWKNNNSSDAW